MGLPPAADPIMMIPASSAFFRKGIASQLRYGAVVQEGAGCGWPLGRWGMGCTTQPQGSEAVQCLSLQYILRYAKTLRLLRKWMTSQNWDRI